MSTGFACVGLDHPKSSVNVGSALRACWCYGASMLAICGQREVRGQTDTQNAWGKIPVLRVDDLRSVIPFCCVPVAIEIVPGAKSLVDFEHPTRAFYIFGQEDGTLGDRVLSWCKHVVYIPMVGCSNLAATVNVVLYDRMQKKERKS